MKRTIVNTAEHIHDHMIKLNAVILGACLIAAVFYAVNLYSLISHTVAIQRTESRTILLDSALGELDSEYLKLSGAITPDVLAEYGLVPGHVSLYITRPASTASAGNLARAGHEL